MNGFNTPFSVDVSAHLDAPDVLSSGKLCFEFANTVEWHAAEQPTETLVSYLALVDWAARVGILRDEKEAQLLKEQARTKPALAAQIHAWALELREAIYRIFVAIAVQSQPAAADLAVLNEALPRAYTLPELVPTETPNAETQGTKTHRTLNGYGWRWRGDESGLDGILWPILRSTARLLTEGELSRVGQCADDRGCGYLFYDTSRNRSRRWCDMNSCGNRAKSQRHYARVRSAVT